MINPPYIKIIIAAHKECPLPDGDIYIPLHVGAACNDQILPYTRDDSGDNISAFNPLFCELTGLYWAWKNLEYDWLGLVQYRRFFASGIHKRVIQQDELSPLLEKYKVFVPRKRHYYIETVYSHYDHTFDGRQFDQARQVISEKYPEYVEDYDFFVNQRSAYLFNMMIMPRHLIDLYCSWLFDIVFELKDRIDSSRMSAFEKRYIGRVSERLFNIWLIHQIRTGVILQKEVKELSYVYTGEINWWKKCTGFLKAKFFKKKYEASF